MMRRLIFLFLLIPLMARGGLEITVENDLFTGSDNNYTHGTDVGWSWLEGGEERVIGLRSWFYTPNDISIAEPQPDERPWCGATVIYGERVDYLSKDTAMRSGIEGGVQGPSSECEYEQTKVHEWTDSIEPMGWDNQLKDEPVVNGSLEYWKAWRIAQNEGMGVEFRGAVGGDLGTQFIRVWTGPGVEAGWNVPKSVIGGINPKAIKTNFKSKLRVTVTADGKLMFVEHNATITDSYFHSEQDNLELIRGVGEGRVGGRIGYGGFEFAYLRCIRTEEFSGQDGNMDWGMVKLSFGGAF